MHLVMNIGYKIGKMFGQENLPFFQDFNIFPSSLTDSGWSLLFTIGGENFLYFLQWIIICMFIYILFTIKREEKITFGDIRNVGKLLDYMITKTTPVPFNKFEIIEKKEA